MTLFANGRPEDGPSDGDVSGGDGRVRIRRASSLEPPLVPALHPAKCAAAAVWPLPCSLNLIVGPAPATSAWWALGAGAIIRAFPCSALVVSVAESWHSNPRPSSYLRRRCHTERLGARSLRSRNEPAPASSLPARLPFPVRRNQLEQPPPAICRPALARALVPLAGHCCAARPRFHVGALSSLPPTAVDPRPYLPLAFPPAVPLLGRARQWTRSAQPAPVRPCASLCCRVRAAPPLRNVCGYRSRCARSLLARFACARAPM